MGHFHRDRLCFHELSGWVIVHTVCRFGKEVYQSYPTGSAGSPHGGARGTTIRESWGLFRVETRLAVFFAVFKDHRVNPALIQGGETRQEGEGVEERHYRVAEWPVEDRPREKLASRGVEVLSDAELLAILLRVGSRGESVVALSQRLLAHFGGLRGLGGVRIPELSGLSGVGMAKGAVLLAAFELGRRAAILRDDGDLFVGSGSVVYDLLGPRLRDARRESFWVLLLNQRHKLLKSEKIW